MSTDLWWLPVMAAHPSVIKIMAPGHASSMKAATVIRKLAFASFLRHLLALFSNSTVRLKEQYLRLPYMSCTIPGLRSQ